MLSGVRLVPPMAAAFCFTFRAVGSSMQLRGSIDKLPEGPRCFSIQRLLGLELLMDSLKGWNKKKYPAAF